MRPAWRILVCLALGATTTVAIAWAMAVRPGAATGTGSKAMDLVNPNGLQAWRAQFMLFARAGEDHAIVWVRANGYSPQPAADDAPENVTGWRRGLAAPWLDRPETAPQRASEVTLSSYGWPWRTMYAMESNERGWSEWSHVWKPQWLKGFWKPSAPRDFFPPGLPTGLVPWQFAAAVVLWAGAWGVPLFGVGGLRRWRRRRSGRCVNCGYDRRGINEASPCPECGAVGTHVRHRSG